MLHGGDYAILARRGRSVLYGSADTILTGRRGAMNDGHVTSGRSLQQVRAGQGIASVSNIPRESQREKKRDRGKYNFVFEKSSHFEVTPGVS